jgi:hypothetical protein
MAIEVSTELSYGLDGRESVPGRSRNFLFIALTLALAPLQPSIQGRA